MYVVSFLFGLGMQAVAAMAWGTETCPKVCQMQEVWNVSSNKRGQAYCQALLEKCCSFELYSSFRLLKNLLYSYQRAW